LCNQIKPNNSKSPINVKKTMLNYLMICMLVSFHLKQFLWVNHVLDLIKFSNCQVPRNFYHWKDKEITKIWEKVKFRFCSHFKQQYLIFKKIKIVNSFLELCNHNFPHTYKYSWMIMFFYLLIFLYFWTFQNHLQREVNPIY